MKEFDYEENVKAEELTFEKETYTGKTLRCLQVGKDLYVSLTGWDLPNKAIKARFSKKHGDKLIRLELKDGEFFGYARKVDNNMPTGYHGQSRLTQLEAYGF